LEQLSQIVATRVYVADVLIGEGEGCRGAWLIKGDALIAVNPGQATIAEKDEKARRATIRLDNYPRFWISVSKRRRSAKIWSTLGGSASNGPAGLKSAVIRVYQRLAQSP
jgi:hypothetical protein